MNHISLMAAGCCAQVSDANGTMDATSSARGMKQQQQQGYPQVALEERKKTKAKRDNASVLDDIFASGNGIEAEAADFRRLV